MQATALTWLVYSLLTQSSSRLGIFQFAQQIPILILGIFAGALADRANRHRLLIITQFLFMVEAGVLAALTLTHTADGLPLITYQIAISIAILYGCLSAFDLPTRQAFLLELVPREDLPNALALNSLTFNLARIIGPSLAGLLVALFARMNPGAKGYGEGLCFLINALSYIPVLYCLNRLKLPPRAPNATAKVPRGYLLDGIRFVRKHSHVKALMGQLTVMALFGIPYLMMIPIYAREVLHGQAEEFGFLMTSVGLGAVFGGLLMTRRPSVRGLGSLMSRTVFCFAASLIALSFNTHYKAAIALLAIAGFFMVITMISSQTLIQTVLPADIRGRVMSLYTMINVGCLPFGNLLSGYLSEHLGVQTALQINAGVCAVVTLYYTMRLPQLRTAALESPEYRAAVGLD